MGSDVSRILSHGMTVADLIEALADFDSYAKCHMAVDEAWHDAERWTRMSMLNAARVGWFSSDRSIREYCDKIWHADALTESRIDQR